MSHQTSSKKKEKFEPTQVDGHGKRIGIVYAKWNTTIVNALVEGCKKQLVDSGVNEEDIVQYAVPGSYELPFAAKSLIMNYRKKRNPLDAVVCIGCLIKGSTMHFEYISEAVTQGITNIGLDTGTPVIFGVLTCLTENQALERAGFNGGHNHGPDWGATALEMANLKWSPRRRGGKKEIALLLGILVVASAAVAKTFFGIKNQ